MGHTYCPACLGFQAQELGFRLAWVSCMRMSIEDRPVQTTWPVIDKSSAMLSRLASAIRSTEAVTSSGGRVSAPLASSLHMDA